MDKNLPNFNELNDKTGKIFGRYNTLTVVNPYKCYFVVIYPDGKIIRGNDLFRTGWDDIPNGLSKFSYRLSTGHIIEIPKFKAYLPLIETSLGFDNSRVFHSINVNCLADEEIIIYRIILREDNKSKLKIGDIVIGKTKLPKTFTKSWKYTS